MSDNTTKKIDPVTQAEILDHEYDGIQELNNPLPKWWLLTFYGAIIFSFFYIGFYHFGSGQLGQTVLDQDLEVARTQKLAYEEANRFNPEKYKTAMSANLHKTLGATTFQTNCASCHTADGGGLIGPNLTDAYWIHGDGSPEQVAQIIRTGVAEKGMPAWGALIQGDAWYAVTAFVVSLQGTKPASPKEPQGNLIKKK